MLRPPPGLCHLGVDTHCRRGIMSVDQEVACPNGTRTTTTEGVCTHKGLFSNMAAYLYPADLATVASQSVHLPHRSGPLGGGRERPCF